MKIYIIILITLFHKISYSQSDISKQVNLLMSQIRSGSIITVDKEKLKISSNNKELLTVLSKYYTDTLANVRYEALSLSSQLALNSKDKSLINKSINDLISNCIVKNSINNQIVNLLKKYKQTDFSLIELEKIKQVLQLQESNIGTLSKIYAFVGKETALTDLNSFLSKQNLSKNDKKDLKLALVRSGDERLANKMLETLKQQVINDELIYNALPDIIYTKNKLLYQFLLNAILSDSKKCSSANNDDNTPIICAYRLIEQVAPHINNFPITINGKGEINSKDLSVTLIDIRKWIIENNNNFDIITTNY